jgi:hypothetical protein
MKPRTYDVEEANRVLPQVRSLVGRVVVLAKRLPELQEDLRTATYRAQRPEAEGRDRRRLDELTDTVRAAEHDLAGALDELAELDVQLKDAKTGLVDFLSYRDGELVELCWKLGEDSVGHWHRIGEGYPGRKPL